MLDYAKVNGAFGASHADAVLLNGEDPMGDSYFVSAGPGNDLRGESLGRGPDAVTATSGGTSFGSVRTKGWFAPFQGGDALPSSVSEIPLSFQEASSSAQNFVNLGNAAAVRYSPFFANSNAVAHSLPVFLGGLRPVPPVWAPGSGVHFP
jgi:hypothetical protein